MNRIFLLVLLTLFSTANIAQDANYWSSAYGTGGIMVPGATVVKNGDSGVLFYNPALLAFNTKNASNISGNIYNFQSTRFNDGAGLGLSLKANNANILPVLASNTIYVKLKKPITLAYALMSTPIMRFQASQRRDGMINALGDGYSPGNEFFVGQYVHSNATDETTGLLAVGQSITPKLAAGISFSFTYRRQEFHHNLSLSALINDNQSYDQRLVSVQEYYLMHSRVYNLGIKAGLSYELNPKHHLGLLVSLPNIHLSGKGDLIMEYTVNNLRLANDEVFLIASSKQTKVNSRWKTPLSVAGGYAYDYGKGQLYFSAEYFARIKEYNVLTPRNEFFVRPDTGLSKRFSSSMMQMKSIHKSILNFSVGASFPIKKSIQGYASLRTDFNYSDEPNFKDEDGYRSNTATWNLYHMQLGTNFRKRRFNLRAGLLFSYGHISKSEQMVNFDEPTDNGYLEGTIKNISASRFSAGLMLAYIHNF